MNIGKTIKRLRREQNMTQEKLADFLNISPQAVSRWENGLAMPELTLVPIIANLFGVSTDLLFGLDSSDINAAIDVIVSKANDCESKSDKNAESIAALKDGIARFPSSWRLKNELLGKYYATYAAYRDELDVAFLNDAIMIGNEVLDNCTVDEYRYAAIEILSSIYAIAGDKDKAVETIERFPTQCATKDKLLMVMLEGDRKSDKIKENIFEYAELLSLSLRTLAFDGQYSDEEKVQILEKIEKLYAVLLESEEDRESELMCDVNRYLAAVYADKRDAENTLAYLNREADILQKLNYGIRAKASLARKEYGTDELTEKHSDDAYYLADELLYKIQNKRYDFVRDAEEYSKFVEKLERILEDQ